MIPTLALVLAQAVAIHGLTLAPGQDALARAHEQDFPKLAWVVDDQARVSDAPQLGGKLLRILPLGTRVTVAALAARIPRPDAKAAVMDVLALPVEGVEGRVVGYVAAEHLAVIETVLGHCGPDVRVFSAVTGRRALPGVDGMLLDVSVWRQSGDSSPDLLISGLNLPPGLRALERPGGGIAVALAGRVVVLDEAGRPAWSSPEDEAWRLDAIGPTGWIVRDPSGVAVTVP